MVTTQPEAGTGSVTPEESGTTFSKLRQLGSGLMTATGNGEFLIIFISNGLRPRDFFDDNYNDNRGNTNDCTEFSKDGFQKLRYDISNLALEPRTLDSYTSRDFSVRSDRWSNFSEKSPRLFEALQILQFRFLSLTSQFLRPPLHPSKTLTLSSALVLSDFSFRRIN